MILAAAAGASTEGRYPEATEVFHATFDGPADAQYDGWPAGWSRRQGKAFPKYVKIAVQDDPPPGGGRSLRIELDGAGAVALSPPIPVVQPYDYVLEAMLKTQALNHDRAWISVTLLDEQERVLETLVGEKLREVEAWKKVRLGPISPASDRVRWAVLGLHLEPGAAADLTGSASFGDIWFGRLPRMSLSTGNQLQVFADPGKASITCTASGLQRSATVAFELLDVEGKRLAETRREFTIPPGPPGMVGTAAWKPPIPGLGFYQIRATMKGESGLVHRRELSLAVIDSGRAPAGGEFGWSLPHGERPLGLPLLSQLIGQAGINWVKYPLWLDARMKDTQWAKLFDFIDRLSMQGIELVGLLDEPPGGLRERLDPAKPLTTADLFGAAPEAWTASLEPTMTRLGTQVRWWQLGRDNDMSFVAYPGLAEKIARVKAVLDRTGSDVNVGIGWNWLNQLPEPSAEKPVAASKPAVPAKAPWRFLAMASEPILTEQELPRYLDAARQPGVRRWVVLESLDRKYSPQIRATDLVQRMVAAKVGGAEGIFLAEPFDPDRGVMHADGTPGELFLPWRTVALALGGAEPLGSLVLPLGSTNHVFGRGRDAIVIAWNGRPVREELHLGGTVRQTDVWGRSQEVPASQSTLELGAVPALLTGMNRSLARWQIDLALAGDRLPSIFDKRHPNRLAFKNHFDQAAEGTVELVAPERWTVTPRRTKFQVAPGETFNQPFETTLPVNAGSGEHLLRADFQIFAGRPYRFSVYRKVRVGLDDVRIEIATQLNESGELEVQQRLINQTDRPVSFRCHLFAPDRRRLSSQVVRLNRGDDLRVYRLSDGKELLGKTLWLQAEEADGPRVLNYRFVAEQ